LLALSSALDAASALRMGQAEEAEKASLLLRVRQQEQEQVSLGREQVLSALERQVDEMRSALQEEATVLHRLKARLESEAKQRTTGFEELRAELAASRTSAPNEPDVELQRLEARIEGEIRQRSAIVEELRSSLGGARRATEREALKLVAADEELRASLGILRDEVDAEAQKRQSWLTEVAKQQLQAQQASEKAARHTAALAEDLGQLQQQLPNLQGSVSADKEERTGLRDALQGIQAHLTPQLKELQQLLGTESSERKVANSRLERRVAEHFDQSTQEKQLREQRLDAVQESLTKQRAGHDEQLTSQRREQRVLLETLERTLRDEVAKAAKAASEALVGQGKVHALLSDLSEKGTEAQNAQEEKARVLRNELACEKAAREAHCSCLEQTLLEGEQKLWEELARVAITCQFDASRASRDEATGLSGQSLCQHALTASVSRS